MTADDVLHERLEAVLRASGLPSSPAVWAALLAAALIGAGLETELRTQDPPLPTRTV